MRLDITCVIIYATIRMRMVNAIFAVKFISTVSGSIKQRIMKWNSYYTTTDTNTLILLLEESEPRMSYFYLFVNVMWAKHRNLLLNLLLHTYTEWQITFIFVRMSLFMWKVTITVLLIREIYWRKNFISLRGV